jgi:glycosyltransferase involved in cell wall biosynthesis
MVLADRPKPRIALAHDWLCGYRGGEAVLEHIAALVRERYDPTALYVMFDDQRPLASHVDSLTHVPSPLNHIPLAPTRLRRWLLPLYPFAVSQLGAALARDHKRAPIDLLISTSSAAIGGLRPPPGVPHLCYCHAPARYVWTIQDEYAHSRAALGLRLFGPSFRRWDRRTAANVTTFLANSAYTAAQIRRCYDRDADVVHPPVRTDFFTPPAAPARTDHWLIVSALEPYKRVEVAIVGANRASRPLTVIGDGSQRRALEALAGPTVRFLGRVNGETLREHYRTARLLLFPQIEDFGIVAIEAQACGLPVVARRLGGALETVIEGSTGAFFDDATPDAIVEAASRCPRSADAACRANAERFSERAFHDAMLTHIARALAHS